MLKREARSGASAGSETTISNHGLHGREGIGKFSVLIAHATRRFVLATDHEFESGSRI
jgi:hypothetical protein